MDAFEFPSALKIQFTTQHVAGLATTGRLLRKGVLSMMPPISQPGRSRQAPSGWLNNRPR